MWGAKTVTFVFSSILNKTKFKTLSHFVVYEALLPQKFYKAVTKERTKLHELFYSRHTEVHLIRRYIQSYSIYNIFFLWNWKNGLQKELCVSTSVSIDKTT